MKNYWTTLKHSPAACWYITLPGVEARDVKHLLNFAEELLEAGEKEKVFRVLQTSGANPFQAVSHNSYLDYLTETVERTGILPLFSDGVGAAPTEYGQLRTPGQVGYYDSSGAIVEDEVEDLGQLLERLYPEKVNDAVGYMSHVPPVTISGLTIIDMNKPSQEPVYLSISLFTDIWFPWVVGFLEEEEDEDEDTELIFTSKNMFDNRELAWRHTPRFNRFLSSVYESVQELGGDWEVAEPYAVGELYKKMCRVHGIELLDSIG